MCTHPPAIKNIKFHFTVSNIRQLNSSIADIITLQLQDNFEGKSLSTRHNNFVVYKHKYVYTIFFNRGYINCTKVKQYSDISGAIEEFCADFQFSRRDIVGGVVIDNTTYSGSFYRNINLLQLQNIINADISIKANFNPAHFPGLFFKSQTSGTIIVFYSGKYSIVGAKCQRDAEEVYRQMKKFLCMMDRVSIS
jgi:TATA-box binding protein (TBP) (component of TFIID and TFIIIB)